MRRLSRRGKYVVSDPSRRDRSPSLLVKTGGVVKVKHVRRGLLTPLLEGTAGLFRGYIRGSDGERRNVGSPTRGSSVRTISVGLTEAPRVAAPGTVVAPVRQQRSRPEAARLPPRQQSYADHLWVMSSTTFFSSTNQTVPTGSTGENEQQQGNWGKSSTKPGEKLKRKDSKKEGKAGKRVEKEVSRGGTAGGSTRRSRSRKKVGLFACTAGQRSRSCTPERNATLSCRLPVSLDLESLDLQLAEIMARQRDNVNNMYATRAPEESSFENDEPIKHADSDSENAPKSSSFMRGLRRLSLRRKASFSKKAKAQKRPANEYTLDPSEKRETREAPKAAAPDTRADSRTDSRADFRTDPRPDPRADLRVDPRADPRAAKDAVSTSSLDSGISSTETTIRRQGREGADLVLLPASRPRSVYANLPDPTVELPPPCVGPTTVRMGTRGLERRLEAAGKSTQPPPLPLRNRPLPQPSLIRTNVLAGPPQLGTTLVKTIKLDKVLKNKWISGIAITRKLEFVVVDMREAYLLDEEGNLKRTIGNKDKASGRLYEPIAVSVLNNGNLLFSDHSEQDVKLFNPKGQFLGRVQDRGLTNIAGVAANDKRQIFIAGTDRRRVSVHSEADALLYTIPAEGQAKCLWEHPYSIAVNPLTGDILVGDDNKQLVTAVTPDGKLLWKFSPVGNRHFFPSSICADHNGYVFIADLYNEKVYMLDCSGKFIRTILARGDGLKGGPGAIAVDGRGHLVVADEERTIKVFKYGDCNFAMYRRSQFNGPCA